MLQRGIFILKSRIQPQPSSRPHQTDPKPDSAPNPGDQARAFTQKILTPKNAKTSQVLQ